MGGPEVERLIGLLARLPCLGPRSARRAARKMLQPMTIFDRFDLAVAPFPFTDAAVYKPRPILVLSPAAFNRDHGQLIAMMVTTAAAGRWPSDYQLIDLASAGLRHASVARWKIFTLQLGLVSRRIGRLGLIDREPMQDRLATFLLG